jgi:hypothetical protein
MTVGGAFLKTFDGMAANLTQGLQCGVQLGDVQLPSKSKLNAVRARDQGTSPVLKLLQVLLPLVVLLAAVYLPKMLSAK